MQSTCVALLVYRTDLKINVGKSKEMVLDGEEGLECEVCIDRMQLEWVLEFKYLGCFGGIRYQ